MGKGQENTAEKALEAETSCAHSPLNTHKTHVVGMPPLPEPVMCYMKDPVCPLSTTMSPPPARHMAWVPFPHDPPSPHTHTFLQRKTHPQKRLPVIHSGAEG